MITYKQLKPIICWISTIVGGYVIPIGISYFTPLVFMNKISYAIDACMLYTTSQQIVETISSNFYKESQYKETDKKSTVSIIVPAYLPNEKDIILDTLRSYKNLVYNPDKLDVILAYNTPTDMPDVESNIRDYSENTPNFRFYRVPNSKSKAENINYVLENDSNLGDIIGIFDSDHIADIYSVLRANYWIKNDDYDFVQGRCTIRDTNDILTNFVMFNFEMMYTIYHKSRKVLFDYSIFGGSNGYWKKNILQKLKFDPTMLTEDIDCSCRALSAGCRGYYDRNMISTEESPPTFKALWKQRVRWSQGWWEVSLKHTRSLLINPKCTVRQKIGFFLLFFLRELLSYINLISFPITTVIWFRRGVIIFDIFSSSVVGYNFLIYPLQVLFIYIFMGDVDFFNKKMYLILSMFLGILYNYVDSLLCFHAKIRHILGMNMWIVTERKNNMTV